MSISEAHAEEYRSVVAKHDARGKDFVWAAWEAGDKFREYGDPVDEIAQLVGRTSEWVQNRIDMARLTRYELQNLMDVHGIDTMAKIRMELIRRRFAKPGKASHAKITYMPGTLISVLSEQGYSEAAMRNLMHRVGLALEKEIVSVSYAMDNPKTQVQMTLTV